MKRSLDRRAFTKALFANAAGGAALGGSAAGLAWPGEASAGDRAPLHRGAPIIPPVGSRVQTTACAYCIVGCGYKVYSWPVGTMGGPRAAENAFGVDFPVAPMSGYWISPEMHNIVDSDGERRHVVVLPDPEAEVVNLGGNHSLGGSLARKLHNPDTWTADRLLRPQIRVGGALHPISWDAALYLVAEISRYILDARGPLAWGMKTYSYQFYENTYAITKLAFDAVGTPCWAPHDSPLTGSDVPGLSDAGVDNFSAAYADWADADVIFASGVSLYEAHGILYDEWVKRGGAKLIVVDPRRSPAADHAEATGGLFLQIKPGTDTLLHNAIAWAILENGWEDAAFIDAWTAAASDLAEETSHRRTKHALTFDAYRDFIFSEGLHRPEVAAATIGVTPEQIREAARLMAAPVDGARPKTSVMLEKGNYWGYNYPNTASIASLGLLVGAGNRPGQMISRAGGHQRGMIKGGKYPTELSPDRIDGQPAGLNLDRWAEDGNLSLAWLIGCTWAGGGTACARRLYDRLYRQARQTGPAVTEAEAFPAGVSGGIDTAAVLARWREKVDAGGLVFLQQDLYAQAMTQVADLVLPAAGWGEGRFTRMNGERRLRSYAQICDPPGESRPDWWIIAQVARRMGYEGFDWVGTDEIFHEAARKSGGAHDYLALVELAEARGQSGVDLLEEMGTTGIQCPIVPEGDGIRGTVRLHEDGFKTKTGRAIFVRGDWADVVARQPEIAPAPGELWVINRRDSRTWSAMIEDLRNPFRIGGMPFNPIAMHPDDARARGLSEGDRVRVARGDTDASFEGVLEITDTVQPGVVCTYFNFLGDPRYAANNVGSDSPDPASGKVPFKLGRGTVSRIG